MPSGRLVVGEDLLYIGAGAGLSSSRGLGIASGSAIGRASGCCCASVFADCGSVLCVVSWVIAVSLSTCAPTFPGSDAAAAMLDVCEGKATGCGRLLLLTTVREGLVG